VTASEAGSLLEEGIRLAGLKRYDEAVAMYDDLLDRFLAVPGLEVARHVTAAFINKSSVLRASGDEGAAASALDALVITFTDVPDDEVRDFVAQTPLGTGLALAKKRHYERAMGFYDLVVRFGRPSGFEPRKQIAWRNSRSTTK
jgi:tetratricopeptide (TPR) repeat protein